MKWVCCQIGAREHYAVARALNQYGALELLLTDLWIRPNLITKRVPRNLLERFDVELSNADVLASNLRSLSFELAATTSGLRGWRRMLARNSWFQRRAISELSTLREGPRTIVAFSYAARDIFRFARQQGWRTVLGQIDAGALAGRLSERLFAENGSSTYDRPPAEYWDHWREECALADRIVVNSGWSKEALQAEGVPASKLRVIPLAYRWPLESVATKRVYPLSFSQSRPLKVLFLGTIGLLKGIRPLLDAIRLLRDDPVEFWFVGHVQATIPADLRKDPRIHWIGAIARSETAAYFRSSDVFIFPTFSDGFGLTQLEAQAWKLPIIASRFCGNVVQHGHNGLLLTEVTGSEIADGIRRCIQRPQLLSEFAENAVNGDKFQLGEVGKQWLGVFERM